ncbi:MAG: zf-HC2 domain-containing protein [Pyrinomonadaceae bacterium]|nr:zf-HC2 domain-containing protein [Pyrinomonadaceae bacterium]
MSEHLTNQQVERYRKRALAPAQLIQMDEHLAACAECRRMLGADKAERQMLSFSTDLDSVATVEHLDDEQLAAYADGALNAAEAEIIESHLVVCARCELLASELLIFRDEIAADLATEYAPPAQAIRSTAQTPSLAQRFSSYLKSLFAFNSPAMAFGMGALALVVVGGFVWLIIRANRTNTTEPQVVQTASPTPTASPEKGAQPDTGPSQSPVPSPTASPQVLLALNDGAYQVAIDEQGNVSGLNDLPPGYREMVRTALTSERAANPASVSGLGGRQSQLRGSAAPDLGSVLALRAPVGKVVLSNQPTLSWSALNGATEYKVAVYDSNFNLVASSPSLVKNFWTVSPALPRGQIYSWQVTAIKDGAEVKVPLPPAPEAKFKTLDQRRANQVQQAQKNYSNSRLTMGVLYAQAGMLDEAEHEFYMLVVANPKSEVARKLLNNVRAAKKGKR